VTLSLLISLSLLAQAPSLPEPPLDALPAPAQKALAPVQRAALARPDDARVVGTFAKTLHAWEMWEPAHQAYARLQQLEPKVFDWRYLDGVVLQRLARHADAAEQFRGALAIAKDYLPARIKLAEALFESGKVIESQPLFAALAREPAAEPIAEFNLGRIAAAAGDHATAVRHLERAVALFPELGAAHYALARSYRALRRPDEAAKAIALYQQHGARWPAVDDERLASVTALKSDARSEVARGMKLAERGDVEGAIAAHEAALAADPQLADAHSNLISLYGRAGAFKKAEEQYRAVVARGVNLGDAHYDYGVLLGMQERWDESAAAYERAIAVNPRHAEAHNNLGQVFERLRRFDDAAREYRLAVESRPAFRLARFNLGRMLIAAGDTAGAIAELQQTVEPRDAETPRYLFALSVAHVRSGKRDEGIKLGNEARRLALELGQHDLAAAIERDLARVR
jgi:tetratricopeptide (TPR) repeat protein